MYQRISSILLAVFMFLGFSFVQTDFQRLVFLTLGLILVATVINIRRLGFVWPHLLLPILFLAAAGSTYAMLNYEAIRIWFLVAGCLAFYFLEIKLGQESHFLQGLFLLSAFGLFVTLFAADFYFRINQIWMFAAGYFVAWLLITQGLAGFELPAKKYFVQLIALIVAQTALGLSLWPTHFAASGAVLFLIFYLLWIFAVSAFFGKLSRTKIYWQLGLAAIALLAILATTPWRPLNY